MCRERLVRLIAGAFILISVALGWFVTPWFFLFAAFVGANLFQSAISRWCLMDDILKALGVAPCPSSDSTAARDHEAEADSSEG